MATEAEEAACPVCGESLPDRPPSCFRCETPLGRWWPLDDALRRAEAGVPAARPERRAASRVVAAAAFLAGAALAVLLTRTAQAPTTTLGPPAAATPPPALAGPPPAVTPVAVADGQPPPPAVVRYRVQPGDSLWRVAAALPGEGRRWRELWPERAARPEGLRPGTVLEVPPAALADPRP